MKQLLSMACAGWCCLAAQADTLSVTPSADTTISENNGAKADGLTPHLIVGHLPNVNAVARGLLRFDLTNFPSGAVVTSATMRVVVTLSANSAAETHSLHVLQAGWSETNANWTTSGTATWNEPGSDFTSTPDATIGIGAAGTYTFASTPEFIQTVQNWLTNSASNFGWVLRNQTEASGRSGRRINTRESLTDKPTLLVGYTVPPPPTPAVTLTAPRAATNKFSFGFVTTNGAAYRVQYKESLTTGGWIELTNLPSATGGSIRIEDSLSATQRYYRVVSP